MPGTPMTYRHHNEIRCSLHGKRVASVTEYWDHGNKRNTHTWVVLVSDPGLTATSDIRETYQTKRQAVKKYDEICKSLIPAEISHNNPV